MIGYFVCLWTMCSWLHHSSHIAQFIKSFVIQTCWIHPMVTQSWIMVKKINFCFRSSSPAHSPLRPWVLYQNILLSGGLLCFKLSTTCGEQWVKIVFCTFSYSSLNIIADYAYVDTKTSTNHYKQWSRPSSLLSLVVCPNHTPPFVLAVLQPASELN